MPIAARMAMMIMIIKSSTIVNPAVVFLIDMSIPPPLAVMSISSYTAAQVFELKI